jgi:hypothetical protein
VKTVKIGKFTGRLAAAVRRDRGARRRSPALIAKISRRAWKEEGGGGCRWGGRLLGFYPAAMK